MLKMLRRSTPLRRLPIAWMSSMPSQSKATGEPGVTRASWGVSCEARQWCCLARRVLGAIVVLGLLWVGFLVVVVAVLVLALDYGVITGRPLIEEIWSTGAVVTGMLAG